MTLAEIRNDIGYLSNRVQDVAKSVEHVSKDDVKQVPKDVKHVSKGVEHISDNIYHLTVWMKQLPLGMLSMIKNEMQCMNTKIFVAFQIAMDTSTGTTNVEFANVETALTSALSRLDDIKHFLETRSFSARE
ncbi:hypothetical protein Trisim1_007253 [Trichoderma cf. simile WF8]